MDSSGVLVIILFIVGLFVVGVYYTGAFIDALSAFLEELPRIRKGNRERTKKQEVKDPVILLKLRYVKGEIRKEEYEEMKKAIET